MFNKKSIGLCKLFFISIIAFTSLDLAADESASNTIPALDSDGDGHIDWFEIDVITNGQVHPDWDYGLTGFIGFVEHEDDMSASEILNELRPSQKSRNQYLSRIRYCETNQSKKFSEFVTASRAAMQDENISAEEQDSHVCQNQEITVVDNRDDEHAEDNLDQSAESFLKASFRSLPADSELYGPYGGGYPRRDLSQFNRNTLNISRSAHLVIPEADEIYLEIEIRNSDSLGWGDFWVSLSNLGWKYQKPLHASPWGDKRCEINGEKIQGPFFPDLCDFNLYRIPLKSKSTEGTNHLSDSNDFLDNIDTITLDFIRQYQYACQWDYECIFFKASHDIKNIKIVGGDRFPNDPNEYIDSDNDGIGGNSDSDNDNDGTLNELDAFPYNPYAKADMDGDGFANLADMDRDGDGIPQSDFRLDMSNPENGWFGLNISPNNYEVFYNAAIEAGCEVYDLDCYGSNLARSLNVNSDNLLLLEGNSGGVLIWEGSDYFRFDNDADNDGYIDNTTSPYSPNPEIDAFPLDPTAWADVDFDCVPDNIDNDLNSIPDTDCDGLNNSIDTDDDNDSIPDSLIVPVIVEGALDTQWSAGSNIIDETGLNLCAIEDVESNPNGSCNQLDISHQSDNDHAGIFKLDFQKKSEINHQGTRRGVVFKTYDYLDIYSVSLDDRFYPAGYLEVELKLTGATGGESVGFNLISSNENLSQTLPIDLKTYWPKVYSGEWTSLKIPLYEFFADMRHFEQIRQFLVVPDLAKISGLRVSSNLGESAYSVSIKNIQFVIEDKFPLQAPECCWGNEFSNNDFDNDGASGVYDEHPFVANIDTDNDGITDGVDDDIDGDNISNNHEIEAGTDPYNSDTDGDGVNDNRDFSPLDPADDGFFPLDISGTWRLRHKAGAMGVGRAEGSIGDWASTDFTITAQDCLFDDTYTFTANNIDDQERGSEGQFQQEMGEETWLEPWQSPNGIEECGAPQSPFDGSNLDMRYDWNAAQSTLTLYGYGAHIAKPRVTNYLENTGAIPVDQPTVYKIATASDCLIVLNIQSAGPSPWWHFELENLACVDDDPDNGNVGGGSVGTGGSSGSGDNSNPPISMNGELYSSESFDLTVAFGDPVSATVSGSDGDIFSSPDTSTTGAYAGFAFNYGQLDDIYAINPLIDRPLTFGAGGNITFAASVISGGTADVRFVLQRLPFDTEGNGEADTEPSYATETVKVSGSETGFYSFEIPSQYASTFSQILLYIDTPNEAVKINDVKVFVTPASFGDVAGPFDMTTPFGNATIVDRGEGNDPFYFVDSSQDYGFSGFAHNFATGSGYSENPLIANPLTFGSGGKVTFIASVPYGQTLNTADIRFRFEKEFSEFGDVNVTKPSCDSYSVRVQGEYSTEYEIAMPIQADRTFSNIIMYIDTPDTNVLISDIRVVTTPADPDVGRDSCDYDSIGRQGPLDMTGAYGYGAVSGAEGELFMNDTSLGGIFGGFSNKTIELYPFEFGEGGTLEFTASVPEGQSLTDVDIEFEFQKENSDLDKICEKSPLWRTPRATISGSADQSYSVDIPSQGGNTFSNMIVEILSNDVNVKITDVYVTTTAKTEDDPSVPEGCEGMSPPSVYPADDESVDDFDDDAYLSTFGIAADGFNSAAYFGAFGSDGGRTPTIQDGDAYEFPGESADWAGWSNRNRTLYPIDFASTGFFAPKYIYFCASAEPADPNDENANPAETVSLYFKLENQPFPDNTAEIVTPDVSIARDSVMRAYRAEFATNQISNSFLMFMNERGIEVTFGKVKGTWNGQPAQDYTTDTDSDGTPDYCDDFPNSTPGWIDSDVDGASDDYDVFPNNENEWVDSYGGGVGNNEDGCSSSAYGIDTDGDGVCDDEDYDPANPYVTTYTEFNEWLDSQSGITQNIYSPSTDSGNSSDSESFSSEDNQYFNDLPANYLDYSRAKLLPDQSGEVQIPSGTEKIGYRAFNGLDVTSVTIPDAVTVIESMAFRNNSRLTEVNFGQSITHIGTNAFANTAIQTVALPSTVTYIGSHAFANSKIEQVYLGDSVEYIGDNAFAGANISSLVIPSTLKYLGENAFDYLDGDVYVIAPADQYISIFDFPSTTSFYTCLGLDPEGNPAECTASYTTVANTVFDGPAALSHFDNGHISIPDTYRSIGERAFEALKGQLTSVTIPEGITVIESYAFKGLGLSSITLPNSIITIGDGAFSGNQLTNIILPNSLVHIGYAAFSGNSLGNVILPNNLKEIGVGAFINSGINALVLPEGLLRIEQNAFAKNSITNISLPSSLKFIGERAFESNQLNSVHFQSNGSIAKYAFANNPEIELSIGENVTSIGGIDSQPPIITLNNPGEEVIIQSTSNGETIKIDSNDIRFYTEDTVYYQKSDTDLGLAISIFSDDFEDLDSVEYLPKDPSKTVTPNDFITFDDYEHLNIQFDTQDISAKTSLNLEYRSSDATKLFVGLISETQSEVSPLRELPLIKSEGKWVSVKIPLSFYTNTDLSSIYTLYIEGDNTIDLKNIFFDGEIIDFSVQGSIVGYSEQRSQGEPFNDPGATASSIYFGNIPVEPQNVIDPNLAESQMITYTATDPLGNTSSILREIILVDDIRPMVTLTGDAIIIVDFNSEYVDFGATAFDQVDGILGSEHLTKIITATQDSYNIVDSVDTSETGEYKIRYIYTDAAGNSAEVERKIIVAPPQDAIIYILKDGNIDPTWDQGITAFDQALDWQSCTGPGGCPSIDWEFVNDDDLDDEGAPRGNVLEITHSDTFMGAGLIISSINSVDIRGAEENGFLTFDIKVTEGMKSISFNADCGYPCGGGIITHTVAEYDVWETVAVPVASLVPNGPGGGSLDLEQVRSALVIQAFGAQFNDTITVFRIDNAYYDCRAATCEGVDVPFIPVDWAATHEDPTDPVDTTPNAYEGYTQVWADEFNGNSVNPFNWNYDIGTGDNGWANGELQYYRPENTSVEDGLLIIEAKKHQPLINIDGTDAKYTSSKLKSEGLFEFKYGRVDIRAVVAKGQGMWSAGWMLGANHSQIGWPYSGEIDIFDTIGGTRDGVPQEGMMVNNMYWNGNGTNPATDQISPSNIYNNGAAEVRINNSNEGTTFSNTFHTFSLVWDEDKIEFQLDGETTKEIDLIDGSALAETYRNPFYLILNVAVGGAWPGAPDETTEFPDGMLVDYVRVYQADTDGDGIADYELDGDTPLDQFPNDPNQQFYSENVDEYDSHPNGIRGSSYNISSASLDSDGDGVMDNEDAFVYDAQEWLDTDFDGIGNNADNDDDGDNHSDYIDDFPLDATEWLDTDGDGIGNNSDTDDDNDAVTDGQDAFPLIATEWLDTDGDRIGNNIDRDDDGDLTPDVDDLFPLSERDWQDIDNDGIGDNSDIDSDGDGVPNSLDAFPLNAYEWLDTDNAGVGNNTDNDDDNDDVLDINDAFPLDASESMDTDGDGIGNNADFDDDGDGVNDESDPAPLDSAITGEADQQIISVLGNPVGIVGKSTLVEIGYSTSNGDNTTTGIGFRIHYNSGLMNIAKVIDLLEKDLVVEVTGPLPDSEDHDNDANTDQYYSVGWASLYGDWPNETLPAKVLSLQVTIASDIDESGATSAPINFSSTALAAGYEFVAENYVLDLITSTWDFDGSGHADALTDGLILLRYGFDLTGDNLVRGVMHPDSEMTAAEVEAKIESAANMIDIDMDGEYSALTDGLLLLRYLFDLTGQNLISDVLSPAATRTSAEAITQHIERHMPADVFDNLQDDSVESITIALDQESEISGTADYDNSDFIKMNVVGAGMLTIEITPDNNNLDIDCGLTATTGPSDFFGQNFILDDNSAEIYNDLYDSDCKLTARFTDDREFYLFVDVADGPVTSGSYTVKYSFGVESGEYVVMLSDEGEILGEADYYNSDFIKMNTIGAGQLTIEITPDNNDVDIDCGLTSAIGPSNFGAVNFITDDNNIEILNDSDDSNCGFTATFVDDREFYLFVDFASEESGSYGISYAYNPLAQITD